jgi:PadR family transcriptional regulator, regulatory protein PadR
MMDDERLSESATGEKVSAGLAFSSTPLGAVLTSSGKSVHTSHSPSMGKSERDGDVIPPGTLHMLILKTLARRQPMHGYAIAEHIQQTSDDVLQVEEGSLYPALQRMLLKGWVTAEWGFSENNRRARYYRLTAAGRKQLASELEQYGRVARAIAGVLEAT